MTGNAIRYSPPPSPGLQREFVSPTKVGADLAKVERPPMEVPYKYEEYVPPLEFKIVETTGGLPKPKDSPTSEEPSACCSRLAVKEACMLGGIVLALPAGIGVLFGVGGTAGFASGLAIIGFGATVFVGGMLMRFR